MIQGIPCKFKNILRTFSASDRKKIRMFSLNAKIGRSYKRECLNVSVNNKIKRKSKAPSSYLMVCGNNCIKCCPFCLVDLSTIWKINVYLMSASEEFTLRFPNRYQRKVFSRLKKLFQPSPILFCSSLDHVMVPLEDFSQRYQIHISVLNSKKFTRK